MIEIGLTDEDVEWCLKIGKMRMAKTKGSRHTRNFFTGKEPWHRELIGALGEKAYSIHSGLPVLEDSTGREDGSDFAEGVQVKTACTPSTPRLMVPVADFNKKVCRMYVLMWVLPAEYNTVWIIGAIGREAFARAKRERTWQVPTYYVEAQQLRPLHTQGLEGVA